MTATTPHTALPQPTTANDEALWAEWSRMSLAQKRQWGGMNGTFWLWADWRKAGSPELMPTDIGAKALADLDHLHNIDEELRLEFGSFAALVLHWRLGPDRDTISPRRYLSNGAIMPRWVKPHVDWRAYEAAPRHGGAGLYGRRYG